MTRTLDRVAENTTVQIEAAQREQFLRASLGDAIAMLAVVPMVAVLTQSVRYMVGLPAGVGFSWTWWLALTIAFPVVGWLARTMMHRVEVNRRRALGEMDKRLGASERLVTADEFLHKQDRDGFMEAAVQDAESWIERARGESVAPERSAWRADRRSWLALPVAALALALGFWISLQARSTSIVDETSLAQSAPQPASALSQPEKAKPLSPDVQPPPQQPPPQPPSQRRPQQRAQRTGTSAANTPDDAQLSRGKLTDGETSESQQASNPSSARGEPSSAGQPSKSDTKTPRKPKKETKRREEKERPERERKDQDEPSGSTAGQGSSRGSNNNAAASDWSSKSQTATPDDEEIEDEDDVEDEDEEQKSRGGVQPNMRDRRTPVNRDLQIGFGSNRPNPDANGRGGPGGQKKSRGVASLVLGVPIPDRVTGQPNKGRIRITQQRITPEAQQSDVVTAEERGVRRSPVGPIHHHDFSPWLQNFVRQYFLDRRGAAPRDLSLQDQTQTSSSAESDDAS